MLIIHNEILLDWLQVNYQFQDIQQLAAFLHNQETFQFPALDNGLFPAALVTAESEYTGYSSVWVRDNIYLAYTHYFLGETGVAVRNVETLMAYFKRHRFRFENNIEGQVDPNNVMERPHVRFEGKTLQEIEQKWSHAQNDALGYFLWFYCKLAREGFLQPQSDDLEMLALFPLYFRAIRYWQDEDNGHWEEMRKIEASSVGAVIAGLQALRQFLMLTNLASNCRYKHQTVTIALLDELIQIGRETLNRILPAECIQPKPQGRRYDAALLFLIFPLQVVDGDIADQILRDVTGQLQGDYGIRRYLGDSFWAADYKKKLDPEVRTADFSDDLSARDALLKEGEEAQWCIFDPIISCSYGLQFQQTRQRMILEQQTWYLNRSLGQLSSKSCPFGAFKCPELYYIEAGRYVPNDSTPLLWTQANLRLALKMMAYSLS